MHIALISPAWPLGYPNGIVSYVHYLREGLLRAGHRVSVLTYEGWQGRSAEGVYPMRCSTLSRAGRWVRRVVRRSEAWSRSSAVTVADSVMRLHQRDPVDIVEMEESFGIFGEVSRLLPMPLVVKLHGPAFLSLVEEELAQPGSAEKIHAERSALRQARYVTSPCYDTLERTRQHCGLAPGWGKVIYNPVVQQPGTPRWQRAAADPDTLLFVGRFDKRKGGDLLLQAFARALQSRPRLRLVFVGPDGGVVGPDGVRRSLPQTIERTFPPELRSRVVVRGRLPPEEIAALRCQAAMVLVCSRWDNQPNTALEALLQGCPVVAMDAGGMREVVQHGRFGRLARGGDAEDLAAQIGWMLDHPEQAQAMAEAARQHVARAHDVNALAADTAAFYAEVLQGQRVARVPAHA